MRFTSRFLTVSSTLMVAGLVLSGIAVKADSINVATGLDASNTLITTGGTADAHWLVGQAAGGTAAAQVTTPSDANYYGPWVSNGPNSDWIARTANMTANGADLYSFSRTFNLTGFDATSAALSGSWTIDDSGTLALNGNTISTLVSGDWTSLHSFSVAAGSSFFVPGVNTLTMSLTANDNFLEAARLEGTLTVNPAAPPAVPEPGSIALLASFGLTGAAFLARRRKTGA